MTTTKNRPKHINLHGNPKCGLTRHGAKRLASRRAANKAARKSRRTR